jgi:hypothetical protein
LRRDFFGRIFGGSFGVRGERMTIFRDAIPSLVLVPTVYFSAILMGEM